MMNSIKKQCMRTQTSFPNFQGFIHSVTSYLVDTRGVIGTVSHSFRNENNSMIETTLNKLDSVRESTHPSRLLILIADKQPFHGKTIQLHRVHVIQQDAFSRCTQLTHVDIPDTVRAIEEFAFSECCMQSVTWPKSVSVIEESTFDSCASLQTIDIPEGVISIGHRAFSNCSSLKKVHMPDSVTHMGESVFDWCESLEAIHLSDQVEHIQESTFESCTSLHDVTFPTKLKYIDSCAFYGCSNIEEIHLPTTVQYIGYYAFGDCSFLNIIHITKASSGEETRPQRKQELMQFNADKDAGGDACSQTVLVNVAQEHTESNEINRKQRAKELLECIHESIDSKQCASANNGRKTVRIGPYAFNGCIALESMVFPNNVSVHVGANAFMDCPSLDIRYSDFSFIVHQDILWSIATCRW